MVSESKSLVYRDAEAYYAALKSVMTHGGRITRPKNLPELVHVMEKESASNFEAVFAASFAIMYEKHRHATSMARIARMKNSQQQANNVRNNPEKFKIKLPHAQKNQATKDDASASAAAAALSKTTKDSTIPAAILSSTCAAIKLAAILFVHNSEHMRMFMLSVYNDKSSATKTVADTLALSHRSINELKEFISSVDNTNYSLEDRRGLLYALVTLANGYKLPSCSRLAMEISDGGYFSIINSHLKMGDRNPLTSAAVYEPIISKFIKDSVPRVQQAEERLSIAKQMQVNVSSTIANILKNMRKHESLSTNNTSTVSDIDPNVDYEYYRGATNYTRDIVTTYYMHEGRRYRILMYNDCLYDVIGYSVENTDSKGQRNHDCEMFDRLKWSERLTLLDFFTTVCLKSAKGSELVELLTSENNIVAEADSSSTDTESGTDNGGAPVKTAKGSKSNAAFGGDVTITWLNEKNCLCSKTLPIKKTKKKLSLKALQQQNKTPVTEDNFEFNPNNRDNETMAYDAAEY